MFICFYAKLRSVNPLALHFFEEWKTTKKFSAQSWNTNHVNAEYMSSETCSLCALECRILGLADTGQGIMERNVLSPIPWLMAFLGLFLLLLFPSQHTCLILRCF